MLFQLEKRKNIGKRIIAVVFSLFLFMALSAGYQSALANSSVPPLVETQWLAKNLNKPGLRIVYMAGMVQNDRANFDAKHIPGSVYLDIGSLMSVMGNGSTPPDKAKFEALMGRLGISNDSYVIISGGSGGNPFITSAFWLMQYFGHEKLSYLNGGVSKWMREKLPATGAPTKITPATYKATPDSSIYADADYVLKNLKNPKVVIVDTRGADAYKGVKNEQPKINKRTGHIPGAVNLNFYPSNLNRDGTFKSVSALKSVYESKGVTRDKEVITYCQGGIRASHTYFVLKNLLGYPKVRNYVGSWGQWSNLDPAKYPVEK